jgi:6-phosphogluconolactonase (cycloisomerase 2 family)
VSVSQPKGIAACAQTESATTAEPEGCTEVRGVVTSTAAVVSPDNKHLYVASSPDSWGSLTVFSRDPATGEITQLAGDDGCISSSGRASHSLDFPKTCLKGGRALSALNDVAISSDGKTLYTLAAYEGVSTWRRDVDTGAVTLLQCFTQSIRPRGDCKPAAMQLPYKLALSPDDKTLVVGGEGLSTFNLGPDGTIEGLGTCVAVLDEKPDKGCKSAPRSKKLSLIGTMTTAPDGKRLYATSLDGKQLQSYKLKRGKPVLASVTCAGAAKGCTATRGTTKLTDVAVSPDSKGVYTAAYKFVVTNEESGTGYVATSAIGVFRAALDQLAGKLGCVLFAAERGKTAPCAPSPAEHGGGFLAAQSVALTPDGRYALGAFTYSGAVALLERDPATQALTPVAGPDACLSRTEGKRAVDGCGEGLGLYFSTEIAMAPDGKSAYVVGSDGIAVVQVK